MEQPNVGAKPNKAIQRGSRGKVPKISSVVTLEMLTRPSDFKKEAIG